jgi:hypothetical protein
MSDYDPDHMIDGSEHSEALFHDPVFELLGICHTCKHRRQPLTCKAFPDGIPTVILVGDFMHTKRYPGDHGVQYEQIVV